ncbi:hypothetical protein [Mesonia aestuariivivens]|uniref:Uncharacterized protein n=1 Tax=Mesonia aestuariivivens TaxID=2796128 RepID=A0ABS6VXL5_9FLAO|nr:hypothetical protein [Mesonia aestuariivivens]MBW2960333.1 hypothetical protein [Mesonia aestuariivivens]
MGIQVFDHLMTLTRGGNNRTKTIAYTEPNSELFGIYLRGGHLWFKGTVHNGLKKYIDYCNQNAINLSISKANVWAWARGGASSTPMLYRYKNLADIALFANVGQANVWQNITAGATTSAINLVPPHLRPDIVFQGLKNKKVGSAGKSNTVRVHQLVFHESGHYSHARRAGRLFWAKNFGATIANGIGDPYSDGSQPSYQAGARIALVEGSGNFTEFKITNFYYNKSFYTSQNNLSAFFPADAPGNTNSIEGYMENFDVYDRPMQDERRDDRSWFLHGLFWDLLDNRNEISVGNFTFSQRLDGSGDFINNINDNVNLPGSNDFDLSAIFNVLGSNTHDVCDLKNRLLNNNPTMINGLHQSFNSYGYCVPQL